MDSNLAQLPDPGRVLAAALISAGKELGLTQAALGAVIGRDRTAFLGDLDDPRDGGGGVVRHGNPSAKPRRDRGKSVRFAQPDAT